MKLAIITKSATAKSGARVPFELAQTLKNKFNVTIFAQKQNADIDLKNKFKNLKLYKSSIQLYQLLKAGGFDFISFHATLAEMITAKLTGIPIVATYYGTQFDAYLEKNLPDEKPSPTDLLINEITNKAIWLVIKLQMSLATKVISISVYTQKELKKLYGIKSTVIYLGTNLRPKNSSQQSAVSGQLTILSVSRFTPYKGFHTLLEVAKSLHSKGIKIKVIIAGSSQNLKYLKYLKKLKEPGDQILQDLDDRELAKLYASCDIYATCDRFLFFGLPIIEAASFGKPAVCLNFAAANEVVDDKKTGYVAKNQEELAKYIKKLAENLSLRQKLGQNAQKLAKQKFNWQQIADEYYQVLKIEN